LPVFTRPPRYLKSVEEEADPFVIALVRQVYGEKWLKAFLTMFDA
jgi:hypothetical protein